MEQIPNWFYRTSAKALILDKDKRFLLIKEEKWRELPWWWLENWESPQECIKRELLEEMGVNVQEVKEQPSYFLTAKKPNWVWISNIIYETKVDLNEIMKFTPTEECQDIKFFNIEEAKKESLFPNVEEFIKIYKD